MLREKLRIIQLRCGLLDTTLSGKERRSDETKRGVAAFASDADTRSRNYSTSMMTTAVFFIDKMKL